MPSVEVLAQAQAHLRGYCQQRPGGSWGTRSHPHWGGTAECSCRRAWAGAEHRLAAAPQADASKSTWKRLIASKGSLTCGGVYDPPCIFVCSRSAEHLRGPGEEGMAPSNSLVRPALLCPFHPPVEALPLGGCRDEILACGSTMVG